VCVVDRLTRVMKSSSFVEDVCVVVRFREVGGNE
jgi:hypothetical protein